MSCQVSPMPVAGSNRRPLPSRIAVIADNRVFLRLMQSLLDEEGSTVWLLNETRTAQDRLRVYRPDIVILDLHIGLGDAAWRLLETLRHDAALAQIPVIVCSARTRTLRERTTELARLGCWVLERPLRSDALFCLLRTARAARPQLVTVATSPA